MDQYMRSYICDFVNNKDESIQYISIEIDRVNLLCMVLGTQYWLNHLQQPKPTMDQG